MRFVVEEVRVEIDGLDHGVEETGTALDLETYIFINTIRFDH